MTIPRVIYVVAFMDLLAVSLIIPSFPSFVKSFPNSGPIMIGLAGSVYGGLQFISSPIAGSLSDFYSRRHLLLASLFFAGWGYVLLGFSTNVFMVILSRIPPALFKHTLDMAKLIVSKEEEPENRAAALARINACSGAGFALGPALGGYLSSFPDGFRWTALLAALLFGFNFILVLVFFPSDVSPMKRRPTKEKNESSPSSLQRQASESMFRHCTNVLATVRLNCQQYKHHLMDPGPSQTMLIVRWLMALGAVMYRTQFTILLEEKFGASAQDRGFILSYMGIVSVLSSSLVGTLVSRCPSESAIIQVSIIILAFTYIATAGIFSMQSIFIILLPQILTTSVLRACTLSLQSKFVPKEHLGGVMGIVGSLTSIARTFGPLGSGWLALLSLDGPAIGAFLCTALGSLIFWHRIYQTNAEHLTSHSHVL